jgi:hypothetical protein
MLLLIVLDVIIIEMSRKETAATKRGRGATATAAMTLCVDFHRDRSGGKTVSEGGAPARLNLKIFVMTFLAIESSAIITSHHIDGRR